MRPYMPFILAVLAACTTQGSETASHSARFPAYPSDLFSAFEQTCIDPAQTFSRPTRHSRECREYMDPETTAAVILKYDGTTEDLPRLVFRFTAQPDEKEYLVTFDAFVNVPQKSGGPVHVVFVDPAVDRHLASMFRTVGGVPE